MKTGGNTEQTAAPAACNEGCGRCSACQRSHLPKRLKKSFRPPFSKGGGVPGQSPGSPSLEDSSAKESSAEDSSAEGGKPSPEERRRGVKRPTGTFYDGKPSPGVPRCGALRRIKIFHWCSLLFDRAKLSLRYAPVIPSVGRRLFPRSDPA